MNIFNNLPDDILLHIYKIALHNIHINSILYMIKNYNLITFNRNKTSSKKFNSNEIFYELYYKYLLIIKKSPIKISFEDKNNHYKIINKIFWKISFYYCNIS